MISHISPGLSLGAVQRRARAVSAKTLALVYPAQCPLCNGSVEGGAPFCATCWRGIELLSGPQCETCATPVFAPPGMQQGLRCEACHMLPPPWQRAHVLAAYHGLGKALVMRLKAGGQGGVVDICAGLLVARFGGALLDQQAVVPVPQHWRRTLQRGANPVGQLGKQLSARLSIPYRPLVLSRVRHTRALRARSREERARIVSGSFAAKPDALPHSVQKVLLVDDVMSSGVTLRSAALALLERYPHLEITVVCVARQVLDQHVPMRHGCTEERGVEI